MKQNKYTEKSDLNNFMKSNVYSRHLLNYQKWYLISLAILIFIIIMGINFFEDRPLIMGSESYYHLEQAKNIGVNNINYLPLFLLRNFSGEEGLFLVPLFLLISTIFLLSSLAKRFYLSNTFSFYFIFFLILSPSFIFSFLTISASAYFTFLVAFGFLLLLNKRSLVRLFSILPFLLSTLFDGFSTIILSLLLIIFYSRKKSRNYQTYLITGLVAASYLINWLIYSQPFLLGPFHLQKVLPDLISDLGGLSGVSFFLLLLSVIGLGITWKKKSFYGAYVFVPFLIPIYFYNTQIIFPLSFAAVFFTTIGFLKLFEKEWVLKKLKMLTFFLLIMGIIFSSITYIDRIDQFPPYSADKEALTWIKENTVSETVIFSAIENGQYIKYFAEREPFISIDNQDKYIKNVSDSVLGATYVDELFPILEKNNIEFLYINKKMRSEFPDDYGLLFLLKNEKFKLVHSYKESEVWIFKKE